MRSIWRLGNRVERFGWKFGLLEDFFCDSGCGGDFSGWSLWFLFVSILDYGFVRVCWCLGDGENVYSLFEGCRCFWK